MLPTWARQTITRIRPGTKTLRGSAVPDWENAGRLVIPGCSVQPAATALSQDGRVLGISESLTCYAPPGADVLAGDRIEFEGGVYVINGEPKSWLSATGALDHIQMELKRWTG